MELECHAHSLISDVALFAGDRVLMVKYRDADKYDHQAGWFLPDDGLHHLEHPEDGAKRILREQLGWSSPAIQLGFIESFKGNDGSWHLAFHYRVKVDRPPSFRPSEDVAAVEWFERAKPPPRSGVAHHGWALHILDRMDWRGP